MDESLGSLSARTWIETGEDQIASLHAKAQKLVPRDHVKSIVTKAPGDDKAAL
jgi:hypothetical protein